MARGGVPRNELVEFWGFSRSETEGVSFRKLTSLEKGDRKSRYKIPTPAALPSLGSGSTTKTPHCGVFSAQDDSFIVCFAKDVRNLGGYYRLRVILSEGLKAKIRWQAGVEVLRRRSKTEERSDDGIYEGIPTAFHRKLTSLEKRDQESLEDPNAAPYEEYVRSPGAEI